LSVLVNIRNGVGVLALDRPKKAHAYNRTLLQALEMGFARLEAETSVVVVQSTGQGAFCGGADLDEMRDADPLSALDLASQKLFNRIARSPCLTIAAVHGAAIAGGCELALACDLRVVGPRARFALPEVSHGLIPSAGGCTRLTRLCGPSVAKQLILFGLSLSADDAVRLGLAMGPEDDPRGAAMEIAARATTNFDPVALRLAKQIIDRGEDTASLDAERVAESMLYQRRKP
jgi:enoyl-CoA hydratase